MNNRYTLSLIAILFVELPQFSNPFSPSHHHHQRIPNKSCQISIFNGRVPKRRRETSKQSSDSVSSELSVETPTKDTSKQIIDQRQTAAIEQFITAVLTSLKDQSFISFTLKGPCIPRRKKKDNNEQHTQQKEKLRGKYKLITGRLVLLQDKRKRSKDPSMNQSLYLQVNAKYHLATDVAQNWKVDGDEVAIGLQRLFATAIGIDCEKGNGTNLISEWGASQHEDSKGLGMLNGDLVTTEDQQFLTRKLVMEPARKAGLFKLSLSQLDTPVGSLKKMDLSHDNEKNVPLSPSSLFFQKLGVTNENGKPVNGMASKLRQCQKFVEIVGRLVDDYAVSSRDHTTARITDMGCGRGYLTFSLHSYLCTKYLAHDSTISNVQTQGIDRRPKLIQEINGIARDLGGVFNSLTFVEGTIGDTEEFQNKEFSQNDGSSSPSTSTLDILIALHACDTATDDAMWYAIARKADIIVTAPCCQHELRPQIDQYASLLSKQKNNPLGEILHHAIYRERHTEMVTDAMRALLLDIAGYDTQVRRHHF